jgi:hypothetical protein
MNIDINNVGNIVMEDVNLWDYPDFSDAFPVQGLWKDTGEELTEEELSALQEQHPDECYNKALESIR